MLHFQSFSIIQQSMVNYIIHNYIYIIIAFFDGFYPSTALVSGDCDCWWGTCVLEGVRGRRGTDWAREVLIWGEDKAWKPPAWSRCSIVPQNPSVTFILHRVLRSQDSFDMRKGCRNGWRVGGEGFFKKRVERVCEVWNKIAFLYNGAALKTRKLSVVG